jgi:hypothetical protein
MSFVKIGHALFSSRAIVYLIPYIDSVVIFAYGLWSAEFCEDVSRFRDGGSHVTERLQGNIMQFVT